MSKFRNLIVMFLFFCFLYPGNVAAQKKEITEKEKAENLKLQQEILTYKELETKLLEDAYEQAIDPEDYIVGPGDYFSIVIWTNIPQGYQLPVTPEGVLIIPNIGTLHVADLTLQRTKDKIKKEAETIYKNTKITAYLLSVRKIRVHVTGDVFNPSTYIATPTDRVSDLIVRAGGLKQYAYSQEITVRHLDGKEETLDFSAFQMNGDLRQNPFVQGGDNIIVPPMNYAKQGVWVEGFVENPGYYPIKSQESIIKFLHRFTLVESGQKISQIKIKRDSESIIEIDLTDQSTQQVVLEDGDIITIPQQVRHVYVVGAVLKPGQYDFYDDFTAKDYVGLAGSTENAGSLNGIKVNHITRGTIDKGSSAPVYPGDIIEVPIRKSRRLSEYFQIVSYIATFAIAYSALQNIK